MTENADQKNQADSIHVSVLLHEVIEGLVLKEGETFVDMTINGAGHSSNIAPLLGKTGTLIGIDADETVLKRGGEKLKDALPTVYLVIDNFRNIKKVLVDLKITSVDKILFDLGLSNHELESSGRGFSFQKDEPLLMTFPSDPSKVTFTAQSIVNTWDEENLVSIIKGYGDEGFAKQIARRIVEVRAEKEILTTKELVDVIASALPAWYRNGRKTHFATKTFQALRMTVNDEIQALEDALADAWEVLAPNGRIAVITFHSMEDRIVKRKWKELASGGAGTILTKKPIAPSREEMIQNRKSRSAKLRIIEKK